MNLFVEDAQRGRKPKQSSAFILVESRPSGNCGFISCATETMAIQQLMNGDGVHAIYEIFEDGSTKEMTVILEGTLKLIPVEGK
jgi:hypothetical protein